MAYEVFKRQRLAPVQEPYVTVHRRGTISLSGPAWAALGEPEAVELLYDREANVMGLRAADPDAGHAYRVRKNGPSATTVVLSGTAFFQYFGIPFDEAKRYVGRADGDVLAVHLDDGEPVSSPRLPNKRGAHLEKHLPRAIEDP